MAHSPTVFIGTDGNVKVLARKFLKLYTVRYNFLASGIKIVDKLCIAPEEGLLDLRDLLISFYLLFR